jgi:hypothetical protein
MICPNCPGNVDMVEIDEHWQCLICNGQWWPPEKPEKIYKKALVKPIDSPELMLWHEEDIDYKPPLPAGVPVYKGGGKSGRKRRKKIKRDIRVMYET